MNTDITLATELELSDVELETVVGGRSARISITNSFNYGPFFSGNGNGSGNYGSNGNGNGNGDNGGFNGNLNGNGNGIFNPTIYWWP